MIDDETNILINRPVMEKTIIQTGYDMNGNPIDNIDEQGIMWIYQEKNENGIDKWEGIPNERYKIFFINKF
mgnify:CR=1 FL=1